MNYCTAGDHYFDGRERVIPSGPFALHASCEECFQREFFKERARQIDEARKREENRKAAAERGRKALDEYRQRKAEVQAGVRETAEVQP